MMAHVESPNEEEGVSQGASTTRRAGGDVASFLTGRHVLVTGASGFVGKALLERLLRCCPHVTSVQLLLRPKRGADAQQRLRQLLDDPLLERVRAEQPEALAKVHALPGDVTEERLGLSDGDRRRICDTVSVVFHSAATVSFNERLRTALRINTRGTQQVLQLCEEMPQLKVLVYLSTAYANCDKTETTILEKVYPPPCDPYRVLEACEMDDDFMLEALEKQWLLRYPNTYTFSKALAEHLVAEATDIPAVIVRPSIVCGALMEPFPGWVNSPYGITGLVAGCIQGIFRGMIANANKRADIVPIDYVVNTLLSAAWYAANHSSNNVLVFNCTSHPKNTITWGEFVQCLVKFCRRNPSHSAIWYSNITLHSNNTMKNMHFNLITKWLARFADIMARLQGRPIRHFKISKKLQLQADLCEYFLTNEWDFCTENTSSLLNGPHTDITLKYDLSKMDWQKFIHQYIIGIRRHVFKEQTEILQAAR